MVHQKSQHVTALLVFNLVEVVEQEQERLSGEHPGGQARDHPAHDRHPRRSQIVYEDGIYGVDGVERGRYEAQEAQRVVVDAVE